ncbi:serine acetyltransferase [Mucilaginibacter sp. UR6-1]|uniref:serine O-acetyltransferase EpsC n=1 Tax=Mucilaginibacter sp. UR6-1 TaxID=1435643 RepID=UPI001E39251A|nr:serine O-acetyltransferase EpsC [Mucilaginibacter sp. UR6-1]MCC8408028.1 serine acetyltransferase [Mucilaginibacter sp. UR6-1]
MNDDFYKILLSKPRAKQVIPSNDMIAGWALKVIYLLYPEHSTLAFDSISGLKKYSATLRDELTTILSTGGHADADTGKIVAEEFFNNLPSLYDTLNTDIQAIYDGDPAAKSEFEVIRTYPGFYAICFYRIAHILYNFDIPFIPRILTEHAHSKTGIDIHPAAVIGEYFHIDHGTGIVIGETCVIGKYVKLYQGVTLGALSVRKGLSGIKRHPNVEDRVIIYSGATILGGNTVIGHDSIIGGNAWLTNSVAPYSTVYHIPKITIQKVTQE